MDVPYNREPHFAVAEEAGGETYLWVECEKANYGWVLNGCWNTSVRDGHVYSGKDTLGRGVIVWRGNAPFPHNDYNEALIWIEAEIAAGRGTGPTEETEVTK